MSDDHYTHPAEHTWYVGQWFRSKLEVRWAMFFDYFKINWEYERRLFNRESYIIPDFYFRDWDFYIEIKPTVTMGRNLALRRHSDRRWQKRFHGLIVGGKPWPGEYEAFLFSRGHMHHRSAGWQFGEVRDKKTLYLVKAKQHALRLDALRSGRASLRRDVVFKQGSLHNLACAFSRAQLGPPLTRNGQFIIPDKPCPYCAPGNQLHA